MRKVKKIQERVAVSAANKTSRKIYTQTIRELSKETGIKAIVLRGRKGKGGRVKHYKYAKTKGRARVWVGLSKIPLSKVFTGKRTSTGVKKFSKYTSGSMQGRTAADVFGANMKAGHFGFYVRKPGSKRLPIQEVSLDIKSVGTRIVHLHGRRLGKIEFEKEFQRDMKRRLAKR